MGDGNRTGWLALLLGALLLAGCRGEGRAVTAAAPAPTPSVATASAAPLRTSDPEIALLTVSAAPTAVPTAPPTATPTAEPTTAPTAEPTAAPTAQASDPPVPSPKIEGEGADEETARAARDAGLCQLLLDLMSAYEHPDPADGERIAADVAAVQAISAPDGEVAAAIAGHWQRVYLDPAYALCLYSGGKKAPELSEAGIPEEGGHAFVVLGYKLKNGKMTRELKGRCDAAAAAARTYPQSILVCSGGATGSNNPRKHTEAGRMKEYLVKKGVSKKRIHIDERARTTAENAVNTFAILREQGIETMTIVTSSYHQRWAQTLYNAMAVLYRQQYGYEIRIVGNYCYDTRPSEPAFLQDDKFAVYQLGRILGLSSEQMDRLPDIDALLR